MTLGSRRQSRPTSYDSNALNLAGPQGLLARSGDSCRPDLRRASCRQQPTPASATSQEIGSVGGDRVSKADAVRSWNAAGAIHRVDFRQRVLVVPSQWGRFKPRAGSRRESVPSRCGNQRVRAEVAFPAAAPAGAYQCYRAPSFHADARVRVSSLAPGGASRVSFARAVAIDLVAVRARLVELIGDLDDGVGVSRLRCR